MKYKFVNHEIKLYFKQKDKLRVEKKREVNLKNILSESVKSFSKKLLADEFQQR